MTITMSQPAVSNMLWYLPTLLQCSEWTADVTHLFHFVHVKWYAVQLQSRDF